MSQLLRARDSIRRLLSGLKPWPIVLGFLVAAVGGTITSALYFLILFTTRPSVPGQEAGLLTTADLVAVEVLGLLMTALGGFVSGRKANMRHVRHGAAAGAGTLAAWLLLDLAVPSEGIPAWYDAVSITATIPAAALGGYAAARWSPGREAAGAHH